jgi:hypothetical protein
MSNSSTSLTCSKLPSHDSIDGRLRSSSCTSAGIGIQRVSPRHVTMLLRMLMNVQGALLFCLLLLVVSDSYGQCSPPQIPPNCENCANWTNLDITVCHAGTNYTATVELCTQYAVPPNPIDNPCTPGCQRAADAITWVRSFCVDQDLKDISETAVLAAIVKGTNLCCPSGNFLGVTIPDCTTGQNCTTSVAAFCHILAMPRCLNKNYVTGCYEKCLDCKDFCMIERRYCRTSPTTCCKRYLVTCAYDEDPEDCPKCNKKWNCAENYFNASSEVCCD